MGPALISPLRKLVSAIRRWLLRVINPTLPVAVITKLTRFLLRWISFLRSKTCQGKGISDKPPEGYLKRSKEDSAKTTQPDTSLKYTVVRKGGVVSLDGVALSSYPFSAHGIRNPSPVGLERPPSRASSRNRGSDTHSMAGSMGGLSLNLVTLPLRPLSRLLSPRRQLSMSSPDLRRNPSPPPSIDIELASPTEGRAPWNSSPTNDHPVRSTHAVDGVQALPEQPTADSSHSYPSDVRPESIFSAPVPEISSSLRPPSAASSNSTEVPNDFILSVLPLTSEIEESIAPVLPENTRRYSRRTRMSVCLLFI